MLEKNQDLSGCCVQSNFATEPTYFKDSANSTQAKEPAKQFDWDGADGSCSKDDVCTDKIEVAISKGGRYNMRITFSGTGSLRNITPLVTEGRPFLEGEDEIPTYIFKWTYTPNDPKENKKIFGIKNLSNTRAGKYCIKIRDAVGFTESSCDGGSTSSGSLDDFELVIENIECSAS